MPGWPGARRIGIKLLERLESYLSRDQLVALLVPARDRRYLAARLYQRRRDAIDGLEAQVQAGLWHSPQVRAAILTARRDHTLLWRQKYSFIAASWGDHDLDIEYHRLAPGLSSTLRVEDFSQALVLLVENSAGDQPPWTEALRLEGRAYLCQLWGDWYLEQALPGLQAVADLVLEQVAGQQSDDPTTIGAHATVISLYHTLGLPWLVEASFRRFQEAFPGADRRAPWQTRVEGDPAFVARTRDDFRLILQAAVDVLELRHPADPSEIELLRGLQQAFFPPRILTPDRLLVDLPELPVRELLAASSALERLLGILPHTAARPRRVLQVWQALAHLGLYDFRGVADRFADVASDDEALGIVVLGLNGEASYRLADYQDAHQHLREADRLARDLLRRITTDPLAWSPAGRGFLARLAQKRGNALLALGDEDLARQAYQEAAALAADDPLTEAISLINLGNLAYLHNNLLDQRGYVTLDGELKYLLVSEGPGALQARKVARHGASLLEAEHAYDQAVARLSSLGDEGHLRQELLAIARVNLGNVAWAWARLLEAEDVRQVDQMPLGEAWQSSLIGREATRVDCWQVAVDRYRQALEAQAGEDTALEATIWSNLSELYYLLGEGDGSRAVLEEGVSAAQRAMSLAGREDAGPAALHPELVWRTTYNLARLHEALGQVWAAGRDYRAAVEAVEAMRASVALDTWQATFLQDKLEVYEGAIRWLYRQDLDGSQGQIFELFERTKARAFLDLLERARVDIGLPENLVARRDDLLARIAACNEDLRAAIVADHPERAAELIAQQRDHELAWRAIQAEIVSVQAQDGDLHPPPVTLEMLQDHLRRTAAADGRETVVLSFVVGLHNSYLMVIDAQTAHVFELAGRREVELAVQSLVYYCSRSSKQTGVEFRAANSEVADLLLGPAEAVLGPKPDSGHSLRDWLAGKRVVVIPDGVLFYLPFEALLVDRTHRTQLAEDARYDDLRPYYLVSQCDVSYAPSASVWLWLAQRSPRTSPTSLLAVYNVNYDVGDPERPLWALPILLSLRNLPGTGEVQRVAETVQARWPAQEVVQLRALDPGGQPEKAQFQSTEVNFLRQVRTSQPRLVLFSGHATYNDKYPNLSGLIFNLAPVNLRNGGQVGRPERQDGFLRLEELFQLTMPATELTFLAACQSGLGLVYRGEGLNALTRAFMYRGSPAVVASLWAVSETAASYLTRRFFQLLVEQPEVDRADLLGEVKRQLLASNQYNHPWYWAPFVLTGLRVPGGREATLA